MRGTYEQNTHVDEFWVRNYESERLKCKFSKMKKRGQSAKSYHYICEKQDFFAIEDFDR